MGYRFELSRPSTSGTDVFDLTDEVALQVARSGIAEGAVLLFVPGSTAALTTIEFEPGVVQDLKDALERLVPANRRYAHDDAWQDGNGYAHVRASLMRPDLTVPVENGRLALGTWQQIVLLDFDNRPRRRVVKGYVHAH
jgi:secondary thiamine-phosphate synthase enzyme